MSSVRLDGGKRLERRMKKLKNSVRKTIVRAGVRAGTAPVAKTMKARAPKKSKLLSRSIGRRHKTTKGGTAIGIVGPRRGFKKTVVRDGRTVVANPTQYAHLVEFGTVRSAPQPFMRQAWRSSQLAALNAMRDKMAEQIRKKA